MMEWMSRMLVGEMAGADEDFDPAVGQMWLIFVQTPTLLGLSMINMGQMILSKPSIIIIWTYQDMMEWMSRMLVGEMAGADADKDFGSEVGQMWLFFVQTPTLLGLSMINMDQMILSKPSIIIIWTYQDMMEWMSRMLVGEMRLVLMRILTWKLRNRCWFLFKPQPYLDSA
jgi:hypothetical protein